MLTKTPAIRDSVEPPGRPVQLMGDDTRRPLVPASATPGEGEQPARDRPAALEEQAWVVLSQRGDAAAFWKLVDAYERRLLYFVRRFLSDPERALDVVQNVWLTVFRRLPKLRQPATFRAWLYQVARDEVVRLMRSEIRGRKEMAAAQEVAPRECPRALERRQRSQE